METGIYVRIKRGDGYEAVDVCEMTDDELILWTEPMGAAEVDKWLDGLARWVEEHVEGMIGFRQTIRDEAARSPNKRDALCALVKWMREKIEFVPAPRAEA